MALGLNQSLTEMSTRNISWGDKGGRCVGLTTSSSSCAIVLKSGSLNLLEPSGPVQASIAIALPLAFKKSVLGRRKYSLRVSTIRHVFVKEMQCVYCKVGGEFLYIINP